MRRHHRLVLGRLAVGSILSFVAAFLLGCLLAQCHHATAPDPNPSEARIIDTGKTTCEPWPQCQDPEPPKPMEKP